MIEPVPVSELRGQLDAGTNKLTQLIAVFQNQEGLICLQIIFKDSEDVLANTKDNLKLSYSILHNQNVPFTS